MTGKNILSSSVLFESSGNSSCLWRFIRSRSSVNVDINTRVAQQRFAIVAILTHYSDRFFLCFFFTPSPHTSEWITMTEAKQLRMVIPSHGEDIDISRWSGDKSALQSSMKSPNTSLRDPLPWLMSQLTAKDKTHPSPQSGPFLSNNVHNGVLWCRYCVNNLNGDLGYWTMRSQPQTYTAPSDELRRCCDFFFFFWQNCCKCPRSSDFGVA